jgi:hypothetical protein
MAINAVARRSEFGGDQCRQSDKPRIPLRQRANPLSPARYARQLQRGMRFGVDMRTLVEQKSFVNPISSLFRGTAVD